METRRSKEQDEYVKQWLNRYQEAKTDVRRLEEELRELESHQLPCWLSAEISSPGKHTADKHTPGKNTVVTKCCASDDNRMDSYLMDELAKREEIRRKLYRTRYKRIQVFQEIKTMIDRLDTADKRFIFSCRYISGKSWEKVCEACNYEYAQMHRIHRKGLSELYHYIK